MRALAAASAAQAPEQDSLLLLPQYVLFSCQEGHFGRPFVSLLLFALPC